MDFQAAIMRLNEFWAAKGCLIWQPHNVQVGAGTSNPATVLRVLGPEPWNVAYVEPSVRPDDGRYGENPNRWQQYYQYQVILKPDPGNPQELYLESLKALGIDTGAHDIRFVEDNWESPAFGAWGLGWEVWLDGQEISQYTYFQQAGGQEMNPVSVEITYGLERIVMVLQGVRGFNDIRWMGDVTYGDLLLRGEVEHCTYNFQVADVANLHQMYDLCEAEAKNALSRALAIPAHDYVLKCSHIFNVLDARGAIGVTERARYFVRMRDLARQIATLFTAQRAEMAYPLQGKIAVPKAHLDPLPLPAKPEGTDALDFLLEIGCEELPVSDLELAIVQLQQNLTRALAEARLSYSSLEVMGAPRRVAAQVRGLAATQRDEERVIRGPAAAIAFAQGAPTKAAEGFARSRGVDVAGLQVRSIDGKEYVVAVIKDEGRAASVVLSELLAGVIANMSFPKGMRWNESGVSFSRPLRWIVALLGDQVTPFEYAGVQSGRVSRGIRSQGSPDLTIPSAMSYAQVIQEAGIMLSREARQKSILDQARALACEVGGELGDDPELLQEVANLVEYPLAIRGAFETEYLRLPDVVLLAVMRKHQRYLPIMRGGKLMPYFIAVANGRNLDISSVRDGNEQVLRARYADAAYFYDADIQKSLDAFTSRLATLTFQEKLGSVLDKVGRLQKLVSELTEMLGFSPQERMIATRAAALCKSDLATQLVVELTSLQGKMGRHYAALAGEPPEVALAIEEHYLPSSMGDRLPQTGPGLAVGLADRLDTLVGLFAVGIRPTGAADPWGLRRAALSLVQLVVGKQISISLPEAMSLAAELLPVEVAEETLRETLNYVIQRYRHWLLDSGHRYDAVDAVLAERGDDLYGAYRALEALERWLVRSDWEALLDSYARCVRISRDRTSPLALKKELLREPAEIALYEKYGQLAPVVKAAPSIDTFMGALVEIKAAITRFFNDVLVMDQDLAVRDNRLALMQAIGALADGIVDLTVLEGF